MTPFFISLEACDPARNLYRSYEVSARIDLLGDWVVDVTFGRIGGYGRNIREAFTDEDAARNRVVQCLRRRGGAPKRIGVSYRVKRLIDPSSWIGVDRVFKPSLEAEASPLGVPLIAPFCFDDLPLRML